jgi:hypothetical protein
MDSPEMLAKVDRNGFEVSRVTRASLQNATRGLPAARINFRYFLNYRYCCEALHVIYSNDPINRM